MNSVPKNISSGPKSVVYKSWKKSFAATRLWPFGPAINITPSKAIAQAGHSAAGSPYTIDPPQVPKLRIARCAMWVTACDSKGNFSSTRAEFSI